MPTTIIAVVHDWRDDTSIELCRTVALARESVRAIIEDHFALDPDSLRRQECLDEVAGLEPGACGIALSDGDVTVELRNLALPEPTADQVA